MSKPDKRELKDFTYEELVDYVSQRVHFALLEEGGKGLRRAIHLWLGQAIIWQREQKP